MSQTSEGEETVSTAGSGATTDPELRARYILALDEPYDAYERYFDALLIKRSDHADFFRDLRGFRSQPQIVVLLTGDPDNKPDYREVTKQFCFSPFAHSWCSISPDKESWSKTQQGITRRGSEGSDREEQRLHRLLVPLWVRFRTLMLPNEQFLERFIDWEREQAIAREKRLRKQREKAKDDQFVDLPSSSSIANGKAMSESRRRVTSAPVQMRKTEIGAWPDDDEDDEEQQTRRDATEDESAQTVARMFVGLAAAGKLLENKRASKYIMKRLSKPPK